MAHAFTLQSVRNGERSFDDEGWTLIEIISIVALCIAALGVASFVNVIKGKRRRALA